MHENVTQKRSNQSEELCKERKRIISSIPSFTRFGCFEFVFLVTTYKDGHVKRDFITETV